MSNLVKHLEANVFPSSERNEFVFKSGTDFDGYLLTEDVITHLYYKYIGSKEFNPVLTSESKPKYYGETPKVEEKDGVMTVNIPSGKITSCHDSNSKVSTLTLTRLKPITKRNVVNTTFPNKSSNANTLPEESTDTPIVEPVSVNKSSNATTLIEEPTSTPTVEPVSVNKSSDNKMNTIIVTPGTSYSVGITETSHGGRCVRKTSLFSVNC